MDRSIEIVRLKLDGRWSADDLGQALLSLSDLYDLRLFLESLREDQRDWERVYNEVLHSPFSGHRWKRGSRGWGPTAWMQGFGGQMPPTLDDAQLSKLSRMFEPEERLEVRRINYASPGFTDLAGIGTVIGHLKDFVLKLVERRDLRRQRELNDDRAALDNDRLRLENARNFVALGRELGYSDMDLRQLSIHVDTKQEPLVRLVEQLRLKAVTTPDADGENA